MILFFKAATKSLETLNIGHNNITNDGIHRLKDGLMQNKTLLRIGLQATKISCEGGCPLQYINRLFKSLQQPVSNYDQGRPPPPALMKHSPLFQNFTACSEVKFLDDNFFPKKFFIYPKFLMTFLSDFFTQFLRLPYLPQFIMYSKFFLPLP